MDKVLKSTSGQMTLDTAVDDLSNKFETAALSVLSKLRDSMYAMLRASPNTIFRAVEVHRELGVLPSLGWQIFRLANTKDPLATIAYIPGPAPMTKVFRAASARGFRQEAVDAAESAYAEFQSLVVEYAGDRGTFDTMIIGVNRIVSEPQQDSAQLIHLKDRRTHFRASACLWGVQCKAWYGCSIIRLDDVQKRMEALAVTGCIGLRQSRQGPPIVFMRSTGMNWLPIDEDATEASKDVRITDFAQAPMRLLTKFSSLSGAEIQLVPSPSGGRHAIKLNGIGQQASADCFAYDVLHANRGEQLSRFLRLMSLVRVPCETLVLDMLVPQGYVKPESLSVSTYGNVSDRDAPKHSIESLEMPFRENAECIGTDLDDLRDSSLPVLSKVIRATLKQEGWDGITYDIFRCKVRYPLLDTHVSLNVECADPWNH